MAWLDDELTRLFAPGYLEDVSKRPLEEIRAMRDECQDAETALSYLRRVAQGRLDIVHVYLSADGQGADPDGGSGRSDADGAMAKLVERLPDIIGAGPPRPAGPGRLPASMGPDLGHDDLTEALDAVLDGDAIGRLPTMSRDELEDIAERLGALEGKISEDRRTLHERIDKLQAEIVDRYKRGEATVEGLLA
jgi:RsiG-like